MGRGGGRARSLRTTGATCPAAAPSPTRSSRLTLKATGSVLLHLQWDGSTEHKKLGLSVRTSSPAWSASTSTTERTSGRARAPGAGAPSAPLFSPILPQGKAVEGGVKRLLVLGSTGIRITTAGVREPPRPGGTRRDPAGPGTHRSAAAGLGGGGRRGQRRPGPALPRSVPADRRPRRGGEGKTVQGVRSRPVPGLVPGGFAAVTSARRGGRRRGAPAEPRRGRRPRLQAGPLHRAAPKPAPKCQPRRPVPYLLPAPGGRRAAP